MTEQTLPKKKSTWVKWAIGIPVAIILIFLILIGFAIVSHKDDPTVKKSIAEADSLSAINEKAIEVSKAQDDTLLTSYVAAEQFLKKSLKDPSSYEEISHKEYFVSPRKQTDPYIQVILKYRAKNSFGGYIVAERGFNFNSQNKLYNTFESK